MRRKLPRVPAVTCSTSRWFSAVCGPTFPGTAPVPVRRRWRRSRREQRGKIGRDERVRHRDQCDAGLRRCKLAFDGIVRIERLQV